MARVTVEDCVEKIPNRFELVMVASQRARKISTGAALTIDRDNDKNPVVSLREIAESTVSIDDLKEELIRNYQRVIEMDDKEDVIDVDAGEAEWSAIAARAAADAREFGEVIEDEEDDEEDDFGEPALEDIAGGAGTGTPE